MDQPRVALEDLREPKAPDLDRFGKLTKALDDHVDRYGSLTEPLSARAAAVAASGRRHGPIAAYSRLLTFAVPDDPDWAAARHGLENAARAIIRELNARRSRDRLANRETAVP